MKNKTLTVNITLEPYHSKVGFTFDTEMVIEDVITDNVRNLRVMSNDDLLYTDKTFRVFSFQFSLIFHNIIISKFFVSASHHNKGKPYFYDI